MSSLCLPLFEFDAFICLQVKRFAEAFFVIDNPRPSASGCYDSNYQNYVLVSEAVRRSRYYNLMPPLAVECTEVRLILDICINYFYFSDFLCLWKERWMWRYV